MRRHHVIAGTLILAGSAAIAVSVLLPTRGSIPAGRPKRSPALCLFPAAPARADAADLIALEPMRAAREGDHFRQHALQSPGLRLLPMPRPDDGRHVGVELSGQPRRRPQPGVVPGRSGPRRPQTYTYAAFSPMGPYFDDEFAMAWVGGNFWDGRVPDLSTQARQPFINPDEMNNTPTNGTYPPPRGLFRPRR